jgi:hypothetical protein
MAIREELVQNHQVSAPAAENNKLGHRFGIATKGGYFHTDHSASTTTDNWRQRSNANPRIVTRRAINPAKSYVKVLGR